MANQSRRDRLLRMEKCRCPVHGASLSQAGPDTAMCTRRDCDILLRWVWTFGGLSDPDATWIFTFVRPPSLYDLPEGWPPDGAVRIPERRRV